MSADKRVLLALIILAAVAIIHAAAWRVATSWLASCMMWAIVAVLAGALWRERS